MKQNHPLNTAVLMQVLLIMVFAMGMLSIQPVTVADAASGAPVAVYPALTLEQLPLKVSADFHAEESASPSFIVAPQYDYVEAYNWTPETTVKLYIDGVKVAEATSDTTGRVFFGYEGGSFNIAVGQVVKITDGVYTEKHAVANIIVRSINAATDIVKGKAAPLSELIVGIPDSGFDFAVDLLVTTDAKGVWLADFSGVGDIEPGGMIGAMQSDSNGNATYMEWEVPDPKIVVDYEKDLIDGWDWWPGVSVTLNIGSYNASAKATWDDGDFEFDLAGIKDIKPGDEVIVSDGTTTKSLIVSNLVITDFDEATDQLYGISDPDRWLSMIAFEVDSSIGFFTAMQADSLGQWSADYSGQVEMAPGTNGWVTQDDGDGDLTHIDYVLPDPPLLTSLSKAFAVAGQPGFNLSVFGNNYIHSSSVWWDGVERVTTFDSGKQLTTQLSAADLSAVGNFDVHVVTGLGGAESSPLSFQVIDTTPAYNGKLSSNHVIFDWEDITGATGYKIQLSPKADFSTLLVSTKVSASNYDRYAAALPRGKTYYWRIRPFYGDVRGPWSVRMPFETQDPLAAPEIGTTIIDGYAATINWTSVEEVVKFKLQVARDVNFSSLILNAPVLSPDTSKVITLPEKAKTYYWRVKAFDMDGFRSVWSDVGSFKVPLD